VCHLFLFYFTCVLMYIGSMWTQPTSRSFSQVRRVAVGSTFYVRSRLEYTILSQANCPLRK
jgi:hypothetical protein